MCLCTGSIIDIVADVNGCAHIDDITSKHHDVKMTKMMFRVILLLLRNEFFSITKTMSELDQRIVEFSEFLADEARKVLVPYYRQRYAIENKQDHTPVTEVDQAVERVIRKLIENNYPEHGIYGEEYGIERENAEYLWVIDPIDGTKSFISGRPLFGTLISLVKDEKPILGVIDQPILQERWLGANGTTTFNGKKVFTRECEKLENAYFATTSPFMFNFEDVSSIQKITDSVKCTLYGGDCYSYGQLASGLIDIVIESGLKPHDYCALIPVIQNAGGKATDWYGNEITMQSNGKLVASGDPKIHSKLLNILS